MILEFEIFRPYKNIITHGVTLREFGSFGEDRENLNGQLGRLTGITKNRPVFGNQIHSDTINLINENAKTPITGDALITNKKLAPLMVRVADCQGILIYDPKTHSAAAIHSGWRGSVLNIAGKTVKKMQQEFGCNPADLLAGISPSLGYCCAEFTDPQTELPEFIQPYVKNRHVDFWALTESQLKSAGVQSKNIEVIKKCTKCNPAEFFSYRNGDAGRMAVFISLK